jgi:hypothetical protein
MNRVSVLLAINRFYRILEATTVAGRRQMPKPPGALSIRVLIYRQRS